jgi:hypothetical protein
MAPKLVLIAANAECCRFWSRAVLELVLELPLAGLCCRLKSIPVSELDFAGAEKFFAFVPG